MQRGLGNVTRDTLPETGILKLRLRNDLEFYPQQIRGRKVWVVKDPLTLRFFHFREEEIEILRWLDGRTTLEQIKGQFESRFRPQRMTVSRLHAFVANLHRNSLVVSDTAGQGTQMLLRATRRKRDKWIAAFSSPLAIQFRGIDPQRILDRLYPHLRWLFTRWCVAVGLFFAASALLIVCGRFDDFCARLPELNALISPQNLVCLAVVMALTKFLHEFGHALTCKHFGVDCHELGIMLLVFTPCLYCNVTDAWKLSERWKRIAITAAGIYVEVMLASICVLLWWFSQPGFFNTLCLNVVVVCSVGTVLLNGNPLLRYDGYYILSDALQAPNLWQDSRAHPCIRIPRVVLPP
jgi:putative peptide zinc metalloprotease protein